MPICAPGSVTISIMLQFQSCGSTKWAVNFIWYPDLRMRGHFRHQLSDYPIGNVPGKQDMTTVVVSVTNRASRLPVVVI